MITKFIEALLLPPGIFVVLMVGAAVWCMRCCDNRDTDRRSARGNAVDSETDADAGPVRFWDHWSRGRTVGVFLLVVAGLLYGFSTSVVGELLIAPLERAYAPPETEEACWGDAIVVLGGGLRSASPGERGAPALTDESTGRLVYGVRLAREMPLSLLYSGGNSAGGGDRPTGAEAAARVAESLGIEPDRLELEARSRTTWENAMYTAQDFDTNVPLLVTSAWHMPRAMYSFREHGMDPVPVPTLYRSDPARPRAIDFLPSAGGFETSSRALHEYIGLLYYRLRY
ncbi:MAG: YdcF family protein [Spirochaetota bacterium]